MSLSGRQCHTFLWCFLSYVPQEKVTVFTFWKEANMALPAGIMDTIKIQLWQQLKLSCYCYYGGMRDCASGLYPECPDWGRGFQSRVWTWSNGLHLSFLSIKLPEQPLSSQHGRQEVFVSGQVCSFRPSCGYWSSVSIWLFHVSSVWDLLSFQILSLEKDVSIWQSLWPGTGVNAFRVLATNWSLCFLSDQQTHDASVHAFVDDSVSRALSEPAMLMLTQDQFCNLKAVQHEWWCQCRNGTWTHPGIGHGCQRRCWTSCVSKCVEMFCTELTLTPASTSTPSVCHGPEVKQNKAAFSDQKLLFVAMISSGLSALSWPKTWLFLQPQQPKINIVWTKLLTRYESHQSLIVTGNSRRSYTPVGARVMKHLRVWNTAVLGISGLITVLLAGGLLFHLCMFNQ